MSAAKIVHKIDHNYEIHEVDGKTYLYNKTESSYQRVQLDYQAEEFSESEISKTNTTFQRWDEKETLLLVDLCSERKNKLENPKFVKKHIYEEIASCLMERGYEKTSLQCENKMKTLVTKYKEIIDYNNKTGNDSKYWKYFDLISTYIGDKPNVEPIGKCSSMGLAVASTSSSKENTNKNTTVPKKKQKFRVKSTPRSEMLKWLKEYEKKNDIKEEERKKFLKQQHEETTNLLKDILNKVTN